MITLRAQFCPFPVSGPAGYFRDIVSKTIYKVFVVHQWHAFFWVEMDMLTNMAIPATEAVDSEQRKVEVAERVFPCIYCPAVFAISRPGSTAGSGSRAEFIFQLFYNFYRKGLLLHPVKASLYSLGSDQSF